MAKSSERRSRKRAEDAWVSALQDIGKFQSGFESRFGDFRRTARDTISGLLESIAGTQAGLASGEALPVGLNAPGILDSLVARAQEGTQARGRAAAQSAADLMPTRGGAALRMARDIARESAGQASNIESSLRAEAAKTALTDRIGILQSLTNAVQGSAGAGMTGVQMGMAPEATALQALLGVKGQMAGMHANLAQQSSANQSQMMSGGMQGLGALGGAGIGLLAAPATGGLSMLLPALMMGGMTTGLGQGVMPGFGAFETSNLPGY